MNFAVLDQISVSYDGKHNVLQDLDLEIREGELLSLLGPSGCGKSTTLRTIAGFNAIRTGTFYVEDKRMNEVKTNERDFGMVFQSYALFPHLSIRENIAFGLKQRKVNRGMIASEVEGMARICGLTELLDRYPGQLSGGQQQRVALARALVIKPKLLLLDEPLSNLDAQLRIQMREEIRRIQQELKITTVFVTHDQDECFAISDRVAIMNNGKIEQLDTPEVIYSSPQTHYVAEFVGFENIKPIEDFKFLNNGQGLIASKDYASSKSFGIRPSDLMLGSGINEMSGLISSVAYLGSCYQYQLETECGAFKLCTQEKLQIHSVVSFRIDPESIVFI
ncbi:MULTISPECIES: ABC transporter ATP-binding protein [unclassified Erysipelothrix]|uniref:ABC transporter ATP-binding protein n=1 Tax=unclassified Erysipelothrix TaxID=2624170 RepID=UPI001378D7B7|nr:ABC transporter ATP-binding protein [Erysipelothrix sp. strain 2 (EsS2-6-Brazil)]MBK2402494.1 ABC transporter ATP-binding protein [Erysipelothrix sp. strain 2 (EsS2-6-Brazil)]NBA00649.1 ATP-binding cassette domain-containing protein [Erysipelothrix rhusiopathiae]